MGRLTTAAVLLLAGAASASAVLAREPVHRPARTAPDSIVGEHAPHRQNHVSQRESCRRWRVIAGRLGETYAGHRLRETVVARACALVGLDDAQDQLWQWPWRHGAVRETLPPRRHSAIGDWEIRCGMAGQRQRCALVQERRASVAPAALASPQLVTHFVIDTIGGRESVVWRVMVLGADISRDRIEASLPGGQRQRSFLACGRTGCLMEADLQASATAANRLWDHQPLTLKLVRDGKPAQEWSVSQTGFRAGLKELSRLRRDEGRALAGGR